MPGVVVGTYDYMAPEQAKGKEVDQRADLYAFGLILYDMLVGPESRPSRSRETVKQAEQTIEEPLSARASDPEIPEALDRIVLRCQERDPADRYRSAEELEEELDKLDDNGELLPVAWRFSPLQIAAAAVLATVAVLGTWWFTRTAPPPVQPDPVSVLVADFQNLTNDPTFDRTLEPILKMTLEEAGFINAYDRLGIRRTLGVRPPEILDENSARELAVNQGVGVVLSGLLDRQGDRYGLSMKALEAVTGNPIATLEDRTSSKDQVLAMATELANEVREVLGDDLSDSARRFAMETLSATSIEVVDQYADAMEAFSRGGYEDALKGFSNAVDLDPDFGLAYAGMAAVSRNMGRQEDAEKYLNEAIRRIDSMTERERYRTRGLFYGVTGDYEACVKEYGDLVARYAGDAPSRNNLALCATFLRDWSTAIEEMEQLVELVPARDLYRENLATYYSYAGDFQAGEEAARKESGVWGLLALAFAQVGQGRLPEAMETYQAIGEIDSVGASFRAAGLADIAMVEGRFADAVRIFQEGATADLSNDEPGRAARKLAQLSQAHLSAGKNEAAIAAAEEVLATSQSMRTRFLAARVLVEAGEVARAQEVAEELASEFQAEAQTYAKIVEGGVALKDGNPREAIKRFTEANELLDTWLGHFDLGRAYLEAGGYLQAEGEFDRCLSRRGEAMALFLDEEPTYGYFPPVYYYQGRVREGLSNAGFAESYRQYLDIRGNADEDPILPEVRERLVR
jgi:tetratricopeptide (TPR) repeat protein